MDRNDDDDDDDDSDHNIMMIMWRGAAHLWNINREEHGDWSKGGW